MKRLFVFLLLGVFLISLTSALEETTLEKVGYDWDNVAQFTKDITTSIYGKYEIKNAVLGLSWFQYGQVADIELKNNSDVCGQNCFAEKEITLYNNGILVDEITFETLQPDGSWIYQPIRNYGFSYQGEIQNYKTICTEVGQYPNGTIIEECNQVEDGTHVGKINYKEGEVVKAGTYLLRLDGRKKPSRTVDWIIKTNGIWTNEWATWGNITEGDDAEVILNSPEDNHITLSNPQTFNCSANITGGATLVNISLYTNQSGVWEVKNTTIFSDIGGIVSYYTLDDNLATTNVIDLEGLNDGTLNGGDNTDDLSIIGKINLSLDFDGSNDYILANSGVIGDTSVSATFWFNTTDSLDQQKILLINTDDGLDTGWGVGIFENGFRIIVPGIGWGTNIKTVSDGEWHFGAITRNGNDYNLYLDGNVTPASTFSSGSGTFSNKIKIGSGLSNRFNGSMDEVGIWNRVLTLDEIAQLYNSGSGSRTTGATSSTQEWDRRITESTLWTCQACDSDGDCGFAEQNRTVNLDITIPQIEIESPNGTLNYNFIGGNETLNVTFTDTNLDTCWFDYNGTNITIEGCLTGVKNSTIFILEDNNLNMTIYANDTVGNTNSTFIEWNYTYLEINRTHNNESFETAEESFNINVEGPTSVTLVYNGTQYTTTKSGNNFNRTIQIPVGQLGNNSVHWRFDDTQDSFDSFQNISETVFTLCNATYTTEFLNISFKDEGNLSVINASIPTSTFEYWLGDGTVTKTLTFINNTDNLNYEFCATPTDRTFNFNSLIQYKQGSAYPQRVFSQIGGTLTSAVTDLILYLLGVSDGLFVTFQVLNVAEQPISGVDISATRVLEGSDTLVARGTTDAAGSVTFWLNPDFQHTITFEKTGLDTEILTIFPTQTAYTVSMGGGAVAEPDQTRGVSLVVRPTVSFLFNGTTYNFNYTISSEFWNLEQFGYTLIYSNGTEIDTQLSTATSGGTLSTNANTFNSSWIRMDYHYLINVTFTNASRIWYTQNTEGTEYSISNFFERLIFYIDAGMFGFDDFGKALISFLILVLVAGGLSFRYGINSEVAIMGIIFGLVLVLDVGLGLIPNPQLATEAGLKNIVTIITGIILFGFLAKEELR